MSIKIDYKKNLSNKKLANLVLFSDEKYNLSSLKKHVKSSEYSFISDLLKTKDLKQKILTFDISSKKKIVIVSLEKNLSNSKIENLGAKFYIKFKDLKQKEFVFNSDTIQNKSKNLIGYFLHGLKLKSYTFDKYKTKKNQNNFSIYIDGNNKPTLKDQIKFNAIEEGTFYTRDLVSEPGNV